MTGADYRSDAEHAADDTKAKSEARTDLPGIFLMSNSFETGGSERQFALLANSLNRSCFDVQLGCIMRKGPFLAGLGDVHEFRLGGSLYRPQSIATRFRLMRHLKRSHITIAHAFDFYSNLTLLPTAHWARVPVVIGSQRQLGDLLTWKQERAQAAILRRCDAVVCNSRAAAARLIDLGLKESQLAVIGNGLPRESFAATLPALPRVPGVLRVGMIARMNTPAKNHRLFLRLAARVRAKSPNAEFVLVGDGPLRRELEREARDLGLGERALFLGDRRDIPSVLASLDISVLPSASESLSNVILESMAAGVPVVASHVGGNSELIEKDRGVLVPANNEEAMAEAVGELIRSAALRADLGRNARAFAQANFTLEDVRRRHEDLYRELLQKKSGGRSNRLAASTMAEGRRRRVVIIAASQRYVGGQSAQADLLLQGWRNDKEVVAEFLPIDPVFPYLLQWAERVPLLRTAIRQPIYLLQLWRRLKKADVAHIFSAAYSSFAIATAPALRIARRRGVKTLVHYHSGEARGHLQKSPRTRQALRDADRLVVPSEYLENVFGEFGLKAWSIPNIVDSSQLPFRRRKPLRPYLICSRGFHSYYCVDVVVRAFAEVQKHFPHARLDLVGGGPLETAIRSLVRDLKLTGIEFKGVVKHETIGDCYDAADIFINASRLDNMPVSVLEAFACGLPVVTTEPEGMRYLVEHERTGLLSQVGDAPALAENVLRLLRESELADRLALNAHQDLKKYSWAAAREQWIEIYRGLISGA